MKILVTGGRDNHDRKTVNRALDQLRRTYRIDAVVQGGSRGVDKLAKEWAASNGIDSPQIDADWVTLGRQAGKLRNAQMLNEHPDVDLVVAFEGNTGTAHMVEIAGLRKYRVWRVGVDPFPSDLFQAQEQEVGA
jgi:hypothetical protein